MSDSPGVIEPWNGGQVVYSADEPAEHVATVKATLAEHVLGWSINRPTGQSIEIVGPMFVRTEAGHPIGVILLRLPGHVRQLKWILWVGPLDETDEFLESAARQVGKGGYKLAQRAYRSTSFRNN